jgi:hypothetical protein
VNRFNTPIIGVLGLVAVFGLGACSADDAANDALKNAGVDANVATDGDLPAGFPADVTTPDLSLESGAAAVGTYTLRYTSDDPAAQTAAYRDALAGAGFTVTDLVDHLADPASGNIAFTASNTSWNVAVSAFSPEAPGGGNYMGVVVTPA